MESIPSGHRMNLILWCGFLLLAYFICNVHSQECGTNQYKFRENNEKCCQKCHPGEWMDKRCTANLDTVCRPCSPDFFMTEFSTEMECKRCTQCTKEYMVYKVNCSKATDALCDCESGYKCNDNKCTDCVKIPKTTPPPTTTTKTSAIIVTTKMDKQSFTQDTVWITLSLCCVCILLTCFILISRHTPPCGWIMLASAGSFWGSRKSYSESSQCSEEEEVPMPVQEVSGHEEWQKKV
ncbi:tumor necrosis factor receptor superfamily member 6 isoform 2-T2 [Clarias gariepinus]